MLLGLSDNDPAAKTIGGEDPELGVFVPIHHVDGSLRTAIVRFATCALTQQ
jgi:hypothetical protein